MLADDPMGPPKALRVLVIDDDIDGADTLAELLMSIGHEVKVAYDGTVGLALDAEWQPHVVFLDLGLPTLDGYEVARQLRARGPESRRILALSGFAQRSDQERSQSAGCHRHLVKPVKLSDILQALAELS
ncbi:MAG TPA: response regulator [Kofleriaceae bacterium]|nr:response regulator [Kofleriaceae bacterium]